MGFNIQSSMFSITLNFFSSFHSIVVIYHLFASDGMLREMSKYSKKMYPVIVKFWSH